MNTKGTQHISLFPVYDKWDGVWIFIERDQLYTMAHEQIKDLSVTDSINVKFLYELGSGPAMTVEFLYCYFEVMFEEKFAEISDNMADGELYCYGIMIGIALKMQFPLTKWSRHRSVLMQLLYDDCKDRACMSCIRDGLKQICGDSIFTSVSAAMIADSLFPEFEFNPDELKSCTQVTGFEDNDNLLIWFWEYFSESSITSKHSLLQFITSYPTLPTGGYQQLACERGVDEFAMVIRKDTSHGDESLPTVSACFNQLSIPLYTCKRNLIKAFGIALKFGSVGFDRA